MSKANAVAASNLEAADAAPALLPLKATKNPLITRDLDLLTGLARHHAVAVMISLTTLDPSPPIDVPSLAGGQRGLFD